MCIRDRCLYYEYFHNKGQDAELAERLAVERIIAENLQEQEIDGEEAAPLL